VFITADELKNNLSKYLMFAADEDIIITKNGKSIAKLTSIAEDKVSAIDSLLGILPVNASIEEARDERLKKHERTD